MSKTPAQIREEINQLNIELELVKTKFFADVADRIKDTRLNKKIKQSTVADYLGVSRTQYTNIELGNSNITLDNFKSLCELLELSADDVLGLREQL